MRVSSGTRIARCRSTSGIERLRTIRFHKKLGSYFEKSQRVEKLARWIATEPLASPARGGRRRRSRTPGEGRPRDRDGGRAHRAAGRDGRHLRARRRAARARLEGDLLPLPARTRLAPDAPPTRQQLGDAAVTWAAVSLADKLDTVVGMFYAGEKPTGSRDPFGLRRQAHGIFKILVDLPALDGARRRVRRSTRCSTEAASAFAPLERMAGGNRARRWTRSCSNAIATCSSSAGSTSATCARCCRSRGFAQLSPADALKRLEVLPEFTSVRRFSEAGRRLQARQEHRARAAGRRLHGRRTDEPPLATLLKEPAELALLQELERRGPVIDSVLESGENLRRAFVEAAQFGPAVDRFFTEIFVMVDDPALRKARLRLMKRLEQQILRIADISEIVSETE